MQTLVERRIYPFLLMVLMLLGLLSFQIRQFRRLYEHIKNDKSVSHTRTRAQQAEGARWFRQMFPLSDGPYLTLCAGFVTPSLLSDLQVSGGTASGELRA